MRGSGRFQTGMAPGVVRLAVFQSPSLRGSGRFGLLAFLIAGIAVGFNPLHCGAVVASMKRREAEAAFAQVSIPFIAGQWSLPLIAAVLTSG